MPKSMPIAVLEAKKEGDDPLKGMQQAKAYADCERYEVKYVFSTNGHRYGEYEADSPAWAQSRYYQDAAIRAAFEKIILDRQDGTAPRVLLTLATGAGKTIIATNLLWRLSRAGQLPKRRSSCDRDELREQAYS
jgi:type I restriction enzyme, R subunit